MPAVAAWCKVIRNAVKMLRLNVSEHLVVRLAAHLALVGSPNDAEAQRVFWALKALFLVETRTHQWERALAVVPATKEGVQKIALCFQEYANVAGTLKWDSAKFDLVQVIRVMLEIPDPRAYIQHAARSDFLEPRALFHPSTFAAIKDRLRGSMGTLSRDREQHQETISQYIKVIGPDAEDDQ